MWSLWRQSASPPPGANEAKAAELGFVPNHGEGAPPVAAKRCDRRSRDRTGLAQHWQGVMDFASYATGSIFAEWWPADVGSVGGRPRDDRKPLQSRYVNAKQEDAPPFHALGEIVGYARQTVAAPIEHMN